MAALFGGKLMANDQRKMLLVAKYLIVDDVSLCPTEVLHQISDTLASANEPHDRGAVSEPFKGTSVIMLGDLRPMGSNTVLECDEKDMEAEDRDWLGMADELAAFAKLNFEWIPWSLMLSYHITSHV